MKKFKKIVRMVLVALFAAGVLSLTGCERTDDDSEQVDTAVQNELSEETSVRSDVQAATDTVQIQDVAQEQGAEKDSIMRAYYDKEIERMLELRKSYLDGNVSPEMKILEVENGESVVAGTLCYIKDKGDFCLPDRELTDEELLEIIEYNYKKRVALNGKTQEQMDAEDLAKELAERAMLEEKVKAAGGISEEEAIEIARKAMEADIGEKAKELKVYISPKAESYGWKLDLRDITDEDDYKGNIAYFLQFDNAENMKEPEDFKDYFSYNCGVNAVNGSISGAYSISGDTEYLDYDDLVWYEH